MATFLTDLFGSIFTPGPTPTLLIATNASFACLQLLFAVLLVATHSIHFAVLSFLSGGLWWAINWFASELQAAKGKEEDVDRLRKAPVQGNGSSTSDSETEIEEEKMIQGRLQSSKERDQKSQEDTADLRHRRSMGESLGETSTEDEWEKVSQEGMKDR
ncbi:MAG: SMK killer toxin resistance protein [Caeruleum heppii]|nr:MAG: SMK killer toxin resistance protein [Caeruleum heppii]